MAQERRHLRSAEKIAIGEYILQRIERVSDKYIRYLNDETDYKVSRHFNISIQHVSSVRKEMFGHLPKRWDTERLKPTARGAKQPKPAETEFNVRDILAMFDDLKASYEADIKTLQDSNQMLRDRIEALEQGNRKIWNRLKDEPAASGPMADALSVFKGMPYPNGTEQPTIVNGNGTKPRPRVLPDRSQGKVHPY
jgi:hypothetical protein